MEENSGSQQAPVEPTNSEVTGVWVVPGWRKNSTILKSNVSFTLSLEPVTDHSLLFRLRRNPVQTKVTLDEGGALNGTFMETTEWLSLFVSPQSGTFPSSFILTVDRLGLHHQEVVCLLPPTQLTLNATAADLPAGTLPEQLVKDEFILWRSFRHFSRARRLLPQPLLGDASEELHLQLRVSPLSLPPEPGLGRIQQNTNFHQAFVEDLYGLLKENDLFVDVFLDTSDGIRLCGHKLILATRSPYLRELMVKEPTQNQFKLAVNEKPLTVAMAWIYTGNLVDEELNNGNCTVAEVLQVAELLKLDHLVTLLNEQNNNYIKPEEDKEKPTAPAEQEVKVEEAPPPKKRKPPPPVSKKKMPVLRPERSLCCLTLNNPIRKLCYAITECKLFEHFIFVTILATCYTLAASTPYPNNDSDHFNHKIEDTEIYFTVIFTSECFMNIIAQGLFAHEGSYLRGGVWNILDFVVVVVGLASPVLTAFIPGLNLKALRAFRVLRPLKLAAKVPALQVVINSIMMAMIPLFNIAILVLFVMALYAIIGLQMFEGKLHQTCFHNVTGEMMAEPCNCGGLYNCEDLEDPELWECRPYWNGPNDGITNFDNIGLAMLTVYQLISLAGWTEIMYSLMDGQGAHWEWIYFVSLVFFGAFFTMNLILGVLSGEFGKQKDKVETRHAFIKEKEQRLADESMAAYLDWITEANKSTPNGGIHPPEGSEEPKPAWKVKWEAFKRANKPKRAVVRSITETQLFYWVVIILVFLNTAILATEHHQQPIWLEEFQENANHIFITLFTGEVVLKMYGLGFTKFFVSLFNRFDFVATVVSLVEVSLVKVEVLPPMGMSVLRCVRLLRLFKFTHYWPAMKSLSAGIIASLQSLTSLIFLLFLFVMIFSMLGMQIFGGKFSTIDPLADSPRTNYDSFAVSMLTVFQILTGEDWNVVMWLGINAQGGISTDSGVIISIAYFTVLLCLGNYILLNVFLAIAVDNLEPAEPEKEEEAPEDLEPSAPPEETDEKGQPPPPTGKSSGSAAAPEPEPAAEEEPADSDPPVPPIPEGSSFFILSQTNPLRVFCYKILMNPIISNCLLVCILISSGCLAAEDPVYEDAPINKRLEQIDYFFSAVFTIELGLKLLIYGIIFHSGAFCRSAANILDLVVVGVSLISIFSTSEAVQSIKILKVVRVLRPLRAVNRAPGLKRVIQCMIVSIKTIMNIVMLTTLLNFMYSVMGVQLFKGALYQCTDPSKNTLDECHGDFLKWDGEKFIIEERQWLNSLFNFDSVPKAMLTLFVVSTFGSWPQMLWLCIDSAGEDVGPKYNNRLLVAFYYISFLTIISFYMINIFVGFVILTFQTEGEAEFAHLDLEKNQRDCMQYALTAKPVYKFIPTNPLQKKVWDVVNSPIFDNISLSLVIMNTVSLGANFYEQPDWWTERLAVTNYFFTAAFSIEFFMKLIALGPRIYMKDAWNVFDFLIVMGSYVDLLFPDVNISFLRLFRAGRLIKLLNKSQSLRTILWTFIKSLKALPYVILLILLVFFIYAIVGMQTFAKVALDSSTAINRNNNFQNFGNTLLLLFRCSTGDGWQDTMMACIQGPDVKCFLPPAEGQENESCGSDVAYGYFISFFVMCAFLVLNLLVAVIMDNFDYLTRDTSILGAHHLAEFVQQWTEFDPDATGYLKHEVVVSFLRSIWPPLGLGEMCPTNVANKQLIAMNMLLDDEGRVQFNATLFALVRIRLQIKMEGSIAESNAELREIILALWKNIDLELLDKVLPPREVLREANTVGRFYASLQIQRRFRLYRKWKMIARGIRPVTDKKDTVVNIQNAFGALDGKQSEPVHL